MPNVDSLTKLREAIAVERRPQPTEIASDTGGKVIDLMIALKNSLAPQTTDAALAAVEQEMNALTMDRDHCQRLYLEACELGSGHARITELEAVVGKQDALIRDLESDNARMLQELTHFNPELR